MSQTEAARTFGASLLAFSTWMRLDREGSLRTLTLKRRGWHPCECRLSAREYWIAMSLVTVRRYPLGLGLEPTDAGAARLRERGGHRVLAEAGIPDDRPVG